MNCNKCNFQNENTAKFCRNCGEELTNKLIDHKKTVQNGWGITGFLLSLFSLLISILSLMFVYAIHLKSPNDNISVELNLGPLLMLLGFSFSLYALLKNKGKKFAIAGITLSAVAFIVTCIIFFCLIAWNK